MNRLLSARYMRSPACTAPSSSTWEKASTASAFRRTPWKTELSEEALWDKYPDIISRYMPFILLSMAQGEVISESHRNDDKYEKRSKRTIDMYGYEDDVFEQFHPKSITPFIDPFDKAEEEQIEEEKERLRQLELSKVRQALSMLQPVQRERLLKSVLLGISSRKIAKEEGQASKR